METHHYSRREFVQALGWGAAAMVLPDRPDRAPGERKPNVIYILADDLGYGDLSSQRVAARVLHVLRRECGVVKAFTSAS